jgi:hypothetical protein
MEAKSFDFEIQYNNFNLHYSIGYVHFLKSRVSGLGEMRLGGNIHSEFSDFVSDIQYIDFLLCIFIFLP